MNRTIPRWVPIIGILSWLAIFSAIILVFFVAPTEKSMGNVQRIFYFHVSSAWNAFLAFFVVFIASIGFLKTRKLYWDAISVASAEIGFLFTSIVLITGPLWAKPVWFVWWTWDVRLTSTLVLWLIFAGFFLLRNIVTDNQTKAKLSSVIGILAFVDVPVIYFSIRWWRTQHPSPVMAGGQGSGLEPLMRGIFFFSLFAFTLLYIFLCWLRYRQELSHLELVNLQRLTNDREKES